MNNIRFDDTLLQLVCLHCMRATVQCTGIKMSGEEKVSRGEQGQSKRLGKEQKCSEYR